jgi:IclR family acetate operon transcriptional repressor
LLLALVPPAVCKSYLAKHPLEPRTNHTITDVEKLEEEFEMIRARGYSIDNEEFYEGLQCLAVPVEGSGGRFVLGVSVPKERFKKRFDEYLAALSDAARING